MYMVDRPQIPPTPPKVEICFPAFSLLLNYLHIPKAAPEDWNPIE